MLDLLRNVPFPRPAGRTPMTPAEEAAADRVGTGLEHPDDTVAAALPVTRWFAFVDLSGFTAYTQQHGADAAIDVLTKFRTQLGAIASRRGVRLAKWLGDGAMLVSVEEAPLVAAVVELAERVADDELDVRAGVAGGDDVLLFLGDDYIGGPVNLAARLCDAAGPGEVLSAGVDLAALPDWVAVAPHEPMEIRGFGLVTGIARLDAALT